MMLFIMILMFLFNTMISSKTVLFISGRDTGSHQESMRLYFTALRNADYNVTVLDSSNFKLKQYPGISVKQIYIQPDLSGRKEAIIRFLAKPYNGFSMSNAQVDGNKFMMDVIEQKWNELSALLATPYDLVVIDDIPCVHGAVVSSVLNHRHGSKIILFSTTKPLDYNMILLGLTKSPTINPYIFTMTPKNSDGIIDFRRFKDRLNNIKLWIYEIYDFWITDEPSKISSAIYLGLPAFHWSKFYEKIGLSVVESIDHNIWPIPTLSMIKHTGIPCDRPDFSKIPQDLKTFIEDPSSKGTIYIAFGSYIDFTFAPKHLIEALVNGVQRLSEYRVIVSVKINSSKIVKRPYIRYAEWSPQLEILNHPKTKAFLTHGGLKSIKESICAKVPIIIMPLFAEQSANAHLVGKAKIGRILNKFTVTEHVFAKEVKTVVTDPIYKNNIERIQNLWTERPISHLDEVVFMTTKYSKFTESTWKKFFEPKSKTLCTFETYCLDFLVIVLLVISVISFI